LWKSSKGAAVVLAVSGVMRMYESHTWGHRGTEGRPGDRDFRNGQEGQLTVDLAVIAKIVLGGSEAGDERNASFLGVAEAGAALLKGASGWPDLTVNPL
jgi:hypothetical protein